MLLVPVLQGCVALAEHEQVKVQLAVEQRRAVECDRQRRELAGLTKALRRKLEELALERDKARTRYRPAASAKGDAPPVAETGGETGASTRQETAATSTLVGTVRFAAGAEAVSDEAKALIARFSLAVAKALAGDESVEVLVEGPSDAAPIRRTGSRFRSNMHLSAVRALSVYHALVAQEGVDASRVIVVGRGEFMPAETPAALRRVEIRISKGGADLRLARPRPAARGAKAAAP